jgi:hypothetical protein
MGSAVKKHLQSDAVMSYCTINGLGYFFSQKAKHEPQSTVVPFASGVPIAGS